MKHKNLNIEETANSDLGAVIGSFNWTSDEKLKLEQLGYSVFSHEKYPTARRGMYTLEKELLYNKIWYKVGKEGTAMDVDGDWGWCRSWSSYETFNDMLKNCR